MAGISIPGVTDQYKTNETVEKLMQIERIPLTREQNTLDSYKAQKDAWRDVNRLLTSLRDSIKTLYSYENPFNNKITTSTDENSVTAEANRGASLQSFKIDVLQAATADRFLSGELEKNSKVPQGVYTFKVGEKQLTFNWKGGSLKDFSEAINKRGKNIVKTMIVGASAGKQTLLIEALETGKENQLIFEGDAKKFAIQSGIIAESKNESFSFGKTRQEISSAPEVNFSEQKFMPQLDISKVSVEENLYKADPRGSFKLAIPEKIKNDETLHISFSLNAKETEDITTAINSIPPAPKIPSAGTVEFGGVSIENFSSDTLLKTQEAPDEPLEKIVSNDVLYAIMSDGSEKLIKTPNINLGETVDISLSEYKNIAAIAIRNRNTGKIIEASNFQAYNPNSKTDFEPVNPVSTAADAIIKYEGIKITRPTNDIDDVVPEITLHIHDKTEKTATLSVKADTEASKDALISFVGKYNQVVAEVNILSQNKEDIINELDYLTDEEKSEKKEKLGMFQSDFTLTSIKSNMSSIVSGSYNFSDQATVTMLSQLGIATNASGFSGSYSQSRLRGYLEIDEKKLDSALENHLDDIKSLFGYDSDGDLIIDSGIAYSLDKQISAYTQTGGVLSLKTSNLDSKIQNSEKKISTLETQLAGTEADLKNKYGQMQGTLNSLENQQNTINNFTRQNNNNNR